MSAIAPPPPPPPPPPRYADDRSRVTRGMEVLRVAWAFLRAHPRLIVLPAISMVLTTGVALGLFVPSLIWAEGQGLTPKLAALVATAVTILPFTFISTFFNVAFLAMALDVQAGRPTSIGRGLRAASRRLGAITAWALLAAGVGALLDAIRHLPGTEWVGHLVAGLGGLAWGLATYFVVPILALEGSGPRESVRRSASVFRRRWGEQVTGELVITVVFGFLAIPGFLLVCGGFVALEDSGFVAGAIAIALGVALAAPPMVLSGALAELFSLDLYRYATAGEADGIFTQRQLEATFQPKEQSWWRRVFSRRGD